MTCQVVFRYHQDGTTLVRREEQPYPIEGYTGSCLIRRSEEFHFREVHLHEDEDLYTLDLYDAHDDSGLGRRPLVALRRAGWQEELVLRHTL